ncbi:MAG: hypothetical protein ABEJ03_00290 [Candidatus Nanohaloarchaea archaeon]
MSVNERIVTWQDWSRYFENDVGEDQINAVDTTGNKLRIRIQEEIESMRSGTHPESLDSRPMPSGTDEESTEDVRSSVDKEWYDQFAEGYKPYEVFVPFEDHSSDDFVHYDQEESSGIPHQGWKVRVAAYPDEAREVAREVLPYLQENDIAHKVFTDRFTFRNAKPTRQEGKFITVYPSVDEEKRDKITYDDQFQIFKEGDEDWNRNSINSNNETAAEIIEDLAERLDGSPPGLNGRRIHGKDGEELQYGETRIHMRYAVGRMPAVILGEDQKMVVSETSNYVTKSGRVLQGRYRGDEITAVRPDSMI